MGVSKLRPPSQGFDSPQKAGTVFHGCFEASKPSRGFDSPIKKSRGFSSFKSTLIFLSLFFLFTLHGCGVTSAPAHKKTIAVLFRTTINSYFTEMEKGIRDTADEKKLRILVLPNEGMEGASPQEILEKLAAQKVEALLIVPEGREKAVKNLIPLIKKANSIKLPIIMLHASIDEQVMSKEGAHVESIVSCENRKGGFLVGEFIAKKLKWESWL